MKQPYERFLSGFESHIFLGSGNDYGLRIGGRYACNVTEPDGSSIRLTLLDATDIVIINYNTPEEFAVEWSKTAIGRGRELKA